jgi:cytochrome d ubiquinol oxidase subunit I
VATGFGLAGLALWYAISWWRHRAARPNRWFLLATGISGVVSIVSLESGWVVTEVGRQPWTVVGLLLTRDAVQRQGNVWPLLAGAVVIYAGVAVGAWYALRALRQRWARGEDASAPYGPEDERLTPESV